MKRDHKGIYYRTGGAEVRTALSKPIGHKVVFKPTNLGPVCDFEGCGRAVHYVRKTYGPRGRKGFWQHTGDGLAQYRSWYKS